MNKRCSLRLALSQTNDQWTWELFHRNHSSGLNQSIVASLPLPGKSTPSKIFSLFAKSIKTASRVKLQACGINAAKEILPKEIQTELEQASGGDVLFVVPPEWASVPFEMFSLGKYFLGEKYRMGTIIKIQENLLPPKNIPIENKMLIIADPAGNLESAYKEGEELKNFAQRNKQSVHLLTSGNKTKIYNEIVESGFIHFAGHSVHTGEKHSTGFLLNDNTLFDLGDIIRIGEKPIVPWFIFSNSCHAGDIRGDQDLSGIAGTFLQAGVSQVIGPIKKVNDEDALAFAKTFYELLFKGMNPSEALFGAKQKSVKNTNGSITPLLYRLFGDPCFSYFKKQPETDFHRDTKIGKKFNLKKGILLVISLALISLLLYLLWPSSITYIPAK